MLFFQQSTFHLELSATCGLLPRGTEEPHFLSRTVMWLFRLIWIHWISGIIPKSKSTARWLGRWRNPESSVHISPHWAGNNSGQCFSVPAVKSLFLIGSCSKFWTDHGTSNVSSAANANALYQISVFQGRGDCIVKMTSLGKHSKCLWFIVYNNKTGGGIKLLSNVYFWVFSRLNRNACSPRKKKNPKG